jgi:hypothetical protein
VFAFSYPRARWLTWLWVSMANTIRRLRGNSFRAFVHSPAAMDALVVGEGFRKSHQSQTSYGRCMCTSGPTPEVRSYLRCCAPRSLVASAPAGGLNGSDGIRS